LRRTLSDSTPMRDFHQPAPIHPCGLAIDHLHQGDCIAGLRDVADGTIDLTFADPPFNIGYEYDVYDDRRDDYLDWTRRWGREVVRVLKPDGTFWLAIGDEFAAELKLIFHRELGLVPRSWVVWYYTFGVHCTKKFTRSHAHLLYFVKDPKRFTFNDDCVLVPFAGSGTTLSVAKKLGRKFLGFELSAEYAARVRQRLDTIHEGQPLEGSEEPQVLGRRTPRAVNGVSRRAEQAAGIIEGEME